MKKSFFTVAVVFLILFLYTRQPWIPRMTEITYVQPAVMIGIDPGKVTLLLNKISPQNDESSSQGGNSDQKLEMLSAEANTVALAVEKLQKNYPKEIPGGGVEFFIIGKDAYRTDIKKYIDFLSRDNELRLISKIYFVENTSAEEAIQAMQEENSMDSLQTFGQNSGVTAVNSQMTFIDFLRNICDENSFLVPTIKVVPKGDKKIITPQGYTILNDSRYLGSLDPEMSRGYNIISGQPTHSIIEFELNDAVPVATVIETTKSKIIFDWNGNQLTGIRFKIHFTTNLMEAGKTIHIEKEETLRKVEEGQSHVIEEEVKKLIDMVQQNKSDFLGIGQKLNMRHPYRWHTLRNNWSETISEIPIHLEITSQLQHSLDVIELDKN